MSNFVPFFVAVLALKMVPFFGPIIFIICIISVQLRRRKTSNSIAFMHPNASSRGGGERVLWMMIKALLEEKSKIQTVAIYIRDQDNLSLDDMLASTKKSFNIEIENKNKINVKLIKLKASQYADPHRYKFSTIIFEALGSCLATVEAIFKFCPEIYLDSTGYGFSLFLPRVLSGSKVLAYIHYPIMSSTMINNISKNSFNNSSKISNSGVLKFIKWVYYQILINLYQFSVNSCHHVWANSTWTRNHLLFGQKLKSNLSILYPPCEVDDELVLPIDKRLDNFIAVGQFRPEKNHKLLISSFGKFLAKNPDSPYKLILIGGVRNEDDSNRVKNLKSQVENLNLADKILFKPNLPYPQLKTYLQHSKFGVHGMIDEHFGIVLVEFQNNGIIPIAHNSAGPKMDIIESDKGFLYETEDKLCDIFEKVTNLSSLKITSLQTACKSGCSRFDGVQFMDKFMQDLNKVVG